MTSDQHPETRLQSSSVGRRQVLTAIGATASMPLAGCGATGQNTPTETELTSPTATQMQTQQQEATIDPVFGFSGTKDTEIPDALDPDHTVGLHVDEEKFIMRDERPVGIEFGAFHFEQAGLHIEPGDIVNFQFEAPEHTVTAYHLAQARQPRVPKGVPWLTSAVGAKDSFWLYQFDEPGVYDLFCAPHEQFGMGMRLVVGQKTEPVVRGKGRPPFGLSAALLGTGIPGEDGTPDLGVEPLAPQNIVDQGAIKSEELSLNLAIPIAQPTPPSEI